MRARLRAALAIAAPCAALFGCATTALLDPPAAGLVARYDFNGDTRDSVGGNHGVVHGAAPTTNRFGDHDGAYAFDGASAYVEIPDADALSIAATGRLGISVWLRADTLAFPAAEGAGYVHWLGKGDAGRHEWTFRMYSSGNTARRENRTSFYAFNLAGGLGAGSYAQDPVAPGRWMHLVVLVDAPNDTIRLYKNGVLRDTDTLSGYAIVPQNGDAPVRLGTRDFSSFFQGAIDNLRVYDRLLTEAEIAALYADQTK